MQYYIVIGSILRVFIRGGKPLLLPFVSNNVVNTYAWYNRCDAISQASSDAPLIEEYFIKFIPHSLLTAVTLYN